MSSRIRMAAGATIYQQHVTYWLDTRSLDGKRRSLGTTDRAEAVNRAHEILPATLKKQRCLQCFGQRPSLQYVPGLFKKPQIAHPQCVRQHPILLGGGRTGI